MKGKEGRKEGREGGKGEGGQEGRWAEGTGLRILPRAVDYTGMLLKQKKIR